MNGWRAETHYTWPFSALYFYSSLCSNAGKEDTVIQQLSLFSDNPPADSRPPITITWNGIHGCTKVSYGCQHCYMFRRDESVGKDPTIVRKTQSFNLPVRRLRTGKHKGLYKIPSGSHIYTCFSSDFFHKDADAWRDEMWDMIRERSDCTFFMITKRPERILDHLPADWDGGWDHVTIAVTTENQWAADKRLPIYLSVPMKHYAVMIEPTRVCDYAWVLDVHMQCVEYSVPFSFHQTGARLKKGDKIYEIPREYQHEQARKARLDFDGARFPAWDADFEADTME